MLADVMDVSVSDIYFQSKLALNYLLIISIYQKEIILKEQNHLCDKARMLGKGTCMLPEVPCIT